MKASAVAVAVAIVFVLAAAPVGAEPVLTPLSPTLEGSLISIVGDTPTSVRFVNQNIQHTATAWISEAKAYQTAQGQPYGLYQRLFSISDGHPMLEF